MKRFFILAWVSAAATFAAEPALPPAEVQRLLDAGQKITFIDVRPTAVFKEGHVPGALNVPALLVPQKQLPPLGQVIVYDEGLGKDSATEAAAALNQKPGVTARVMEGGFASWEAQRSATTKGGGLKPEDLPLISYSDLANVQGDDVVLVDLRKEPKQVRQADNDPNFVPPAPLTDLKQEFGKVRGITKSPFDVPQSRQSVSGSATAPLLVLIDSGDGAAQQTARALKANGVTRFVILAGGEQTLARKGRPGTGRAASTIVIHRPPGAPGTSTNK